MALPHPSQDSCPFARCDPKLQLVRKHLWRCGFLQWMRSYRQFGSICFYKCSTLIQLSKILWTSLGLQHIGMELPREIDTKVLKLGFYMFLQGLHWVNSGGGGHGYPWSLTTCHMFLRQLKVVDPKIHDWNMLEYQKKRNQFCGSQLGTPHFEQRK